MRFKLFFGFASVLTAVSAVHLGGCSDDSAGTGGSDSTVASSSVASSASGSGTGGSGSSTSASSTSASSTSASSSSTGMGDGGPGSLLAISFDDATVMYTLTPFGDQTAAIVADPTNAANKVAKLDKPAISPLWAGTTVSTMPGDKIITLPITATNSKMSARVWSPDANIQVRLKVEDASDPTKSVETEAKVTMAKTWQTLEFDFANEAAGTAKLNPAYTFNKVSIFMNFGVDGVMAGGAKTYYVDDLTF